MENHWWILLILVYINYNIKERICDKMEGYYVCLHCFFVTIKSQGLSILLNDERFPKEVFESGNYNNLPHVEIAQKILDIWTSSGKGRTGAIVLCKNGRNGIYQARLALRSHYTIQRYQTVSELLCVERFDIRRCSGGWELYGIMKALIRKKHIFYSYGIENFETDWKKYWKEMLSSVIDDKSTWTVELNNRLI